MLPMPFFDWRANCRDLHCKSCNVFCLCRGRALTQRTDESRTVVKHLQVKKNNHIASYFSFCFNWSDLCLFYSPQVGIQAMTIIERNIYRANLCKYREKNNTYIKSKKLSVRGHSNNTWCYYHPANIQNTIQTLWYWCFLIEIGSNLVRGHSKNMWHFFGLF